LKKTVFFLFIFSLSLYLLTYKGICTGDNIFQYEAVQNFIHTGSFSLPSDKYDINKQKWLRAWMAKGRNDKFYLTQWPGLSLASIPLGIVGYVIENNIEVGEIHDLMEKETDKRFFHLRKLPSAFFTSLINPIVSALIVVMFFLCCFQISESHKKALTGTLVLGLGTIIWPYSSTYWTQPIVTLCILSSFYFTLISSQRKKFVYLLFAGLFAGYAFITRFDTIMVIPWLILYVILSQWTLKKSMLKSVLMFAIPVLLFMLLQMLWNYYRFGSFLQTGAMHQVLFRGSFKANLLISIPAHLVSLNRSIFIFSPPLILFFFAIKNFFKQHKNTAIILLGIILTNIIFFSKFTFWQAPLSWGTRFLVPITPFLLLPICVFISNDIPKKIFITIVLAVGIVIQLIGVLLPLQGQAIDSYFGEQLYDPMSFFSKSEIIPQAQMLFKDNIELWWLHSPTKLIMGILLIFICVMSFYYLIRTLLLKKN